MASSVCPLCGENFTNLNLLTDHLNGWHKVGTRPPKSSTKSNLEVELDVKSNLEVELDVKSNLEVELDVKSEFEKLKRTLKSESAAKPKQKKVLNSENKKQKISNTISELTCPQCGKTSTRKSDNIRHQLVHTDERPYSCGICQKTFRQTSHLRFHERNKHENIINQRKQNIQVLLKNSKQKNEVLDGHKDHSRSPKEEIIDITEPQVHDTYNVATDKSSTFPTLLSYFLERNQAMKYGDQVIKLEPEIDIKIESDE